MGAARQPFLTLNFGVSMSLRRVAVGALALSVVAMTVALAHDMFLKPEQFFLKAGDKVLVRLLNGTFIKSANSIDRSRLVEVVMVSPSGREVVDTTRWNTAGDTSSFIATVKAEGTHLIGTSTKPSIIELEAKEFNEYLELDGIPDMLEFRRKNGELNKDATERYAKHVKAVVQVGAARTNQYATVLGYPAEIVPLGNPYDLKVGQSLRVRLLVNGKPVANQHAIYGGVGTSGAVIADQAARSNDGGEVSIPVGQAGVWFVKFINMRKITGDKAADHESQWASLSFAVR